LSLRTSPIPLAGICRGHLPIALGAKPDLRYSRRASFYRWGRGDRLMSRYRERSSALQRLARSLRIALAALAVTGITERDGAGQEGSRRIKAPAGLDPVARAVPARRATVSDRVEKYLKANLENLPEVRAASFRDITPGQTSRASLQKTLGEPSESKTDGATEKWAYKVGPFPRVEFQLRGQT